MTLLGSNDAKYVVKCLLETKSVRVSSMVFQQISGRIQSLVLSPTACTVIAALLNCGTDLQIELVVEELCRDVPSGVPTIVDLVQKESCKPVLASLLKTKQLSCLEMVYNVLKIYKGQMGGLTFLGQLENNIRMKQQEQLESDSREHRDRQREESGGARPKVNPGRTIF